MIWGFPYRLIIRPSLGFIEQRYIKSFWGAGTRQYGLRYALCKQLDFLGFIAYKLTMTMMNDAVRDGTVRSLGPIALLGLLASPSALVLAPVFLGASILNEHRELTKMADCEARGVPYVRTYDAPGG